MGIFKNSLVLLVFLVQVYDCYGEYPKKRLIKRNTRVEDAISQYDRVTRFGVKNLNKEVITVLKNQDIDNGTLSNKRRENFENLAVKPRLPKNLVAEQYWITVQPFVPAPGVTFNNSKLQYFDAYTKIRFTMLQDASSVSVDSLNTTFSRLTLNYNNTRPQLISTKYDNTNKRLEITPVIFFKANQTYELEFNYTGWINGYLDHGLFFTYWLNNTWDRPPNGYILSTFFQIGSGAKNVFPCFDDPAFKSRFTVTFIYPTSYAVLGNTDVAQSETFGNGYTKATFQTTPIMSTYQVAFATGDFINKTATAKDGTRIGVWAWRGDGSTDWVNRLSIAINTAVSCYDALSDYLGYKYPLPKLDHVALPYTYYYSMEQWGLIFYDSDAILFHNQEDTSAERMDGIQTRCHQISHQWFGDLVTNEWWSDIMLHESLANYFQVYSLGLVNNSQSDFADSLYVIQNQERMLQQDINTTPVIINNTDGAVVNDVVTRKGGSLLRTLSFVMGKSGFQQSIQRYLQTYNYSNADHFQFFDQFTAIAKNTAHVTDWCGNYLDVNQLMNAWVNTPHYPAITITLDDGGHIIQSGQQPFYPLNLLPSGYNYSWIIPTNVLQYGNDSFATWIIPNGTQCPNSLANIKKDAVQTYDQFDIYNSGAPTYARVLYEEAAHRKIRSILQKDNGTISISTKIRLISDEWATIDRDMVDLGLPPQLHRGLQILQAILTSNSSVHENTFRAVQNVIDSLLELSLDRHELDLWLRFIKPILTNFYNNLGGWNGNNDDWNTALLRSRFLHYAVRFDIGDARQVALQFWNNRTVNELNPDIRRAVYCAAIWDDNGPVYNNLSAMFLQAESTGYYTAREITSIAQGLACAQNPTIIAQVLQLFGDLADFSYRYNLYPAHTYFSYNLIASDVMADFLIAASNSSSNWLTFLDGFFCSDFTSYCNIYYYLQGMTRLWYTDRRLELFLRVNATVVQNLRNLNLPTIYITDTIYYFNYYYNNVLLPANKRGAITYADMTRWLYDEYVPLGNTPWTAQLNHTFDPVQYNVFIRPYFPSSYNYSIGKNFTYDAEVSITGVKFGATQIIQLNSHRQIIHNIRVFNVSQNVNTEIPLSSVVRDYDNAILTLNLNQTIQAGWSINISIFYSGFIDKGPGEGTFLNWDYLEYSKQQSWIFATTFEGGPSVRSLVPSYDEPSKKAIWYVKVQYPADMVALSNSLEESVVHLGNGLAETTFKPTPKMSSYLLAISIGDFAALRGVTNDNKLVRLWTWTGMQNNGVVGLKATIDTINYLTSTLNVSMPLEKIDVLALPQFTGSAGGAMENWGLIIGGYLTTLWNPDYSTTAQLTSSYYVTSHETVHQWFGDLVSPGWWNYIFLNEGFATYWPKHIMDVNYQGQNEYVQYDRFMDQEKAFRFDESASSSVPIIVQPSQLGSNYPLFGTQSYSKASSIIHMIEQTIHRQNFNTALNKYLLSHEQNTAIDTDLFEQFTQVAQADPNIYDWNGNPLNVTKYVQPFFYLATFPIIKVISSNDGITYYYQQNPFVQNGLANNTVYLWNIPLWREPQHRFLPWLTSQNSMNHDFPQGWFVVNPYRRAYARVWYDDNTWNPIQNQIQSNLSVFDPITRASFVADTYTLANRQLVSWARFLNLIKYAGSVTEIATWNILNRVFDEWLVKFKFQTSDYAKLQTFILNLLNSNSQMIFNNNGNWAHDLTAVFFTRLSCYLGSAKCLGLAAPSFHQFIGGCRNSVYGTGRCNTIPPDHRLIQFCYGLRQTPDSTSDVENLVQWYINNAILADYWRNDAVALLNSLACLTNDTQIERYLTYALNNQYPVEFFQNVADSDPSGNRLFNYFTKNLQAVVYSQHFNRIVSALALGWSTDAQLNSLQNFNWQGLTLTSDQSNAWNNTINGVLTTRSWLAQNQPSISAWLNANVS